MNLKSCLKSILFSTLFVLFFMPTSVSAATNTLNFQSKIVNLTDGTNIDTGTPACVVAGNSNDTCDFQVNIYDDPSAGNLLFSEDHVNTEIGQYNGIFNLEINSICNVVSATGTDGNWTDAGDPCISNGGVDFSAADLWIEIGFDPAGGSSFTETFSRVEIRDVASARYAVSASNINGLSSGDFVQFRPGATQTTTSTNTLINLETTANTANPLININENGAGTPDLLRLQNTSSTVFQVANGGFTGIGAGVVTSTFLNLGTSTTGVSALRINDSGGVDVAAPVEGDLWYNGTNLYFNNGILNVDLLGAFTAFIQNGNSYSALAVLGTNDDFSLAFETNGVEKMRLGTDGTLGIATTAATSQVHIVTGGAGSTSGATTMSATSGTSTFTTTATVTLNVGDYIVPNLQSTQSRVVTVGGTGTSFTVSPAYTANVTARTFIIHRKGVTVDGARPLMALRNTLLGTQEWQLRVGALAPGSASFDLYSQTTSQTALRVENDGDVLLGTDTNFGGLGNNSRLYVYGGDGGANIDVMGNAAQVDQATVELQSSDYSTTSASSRLQTYGVSGIGTTFGFANQYLGILAFQEMDTALIATNNTTDLTFITNAVVRATIDGTTGDLILTNDVAVNGGDVTTSAATFNLANTGATTVNAFGAATTVNAGIAGASGTMNLMGGSASTGCTINGTTGDLTCTGTISGSTSPFVQNGNSFGAGAVLGTNDTFNLTFETDGVSRLILDTNGHLTPNVDDTYDLGSTTNRFRDLYLGPATLNIGTSGDDYDISFDTAGVGSLVFNEAGEDDDLRIEGDTNANLFYVDASTDRIGIGTNAPAALFSVGPASEFQVAATGNVTTAGDAAINGGDLTTTAGTFNLVNAGATTLNIGGAATTVTLGVSGASGTLTLMGGNASTGCTINGTTGDLTCTGTINGSSAGFVQNGNSFGAAAILGTNDANSLSFETGGTTQATLSTAGDLTLNNDLAVNGGDLTTTATTFNLLAGATTQINVGPGGAVGAISFLGGAAATGCDIAGNSGNLTCTGDLQANGGDLVTSAGTATVFNTAATTVNIGGGATTLTLGTAGASGTLDLMGGSASTGCTINGTTGSVTCTADGTFGGDVAVNGGDLTTTAGTFNLVNAGATTLNIGGAATTVTLGISGASGTLDLMGGSASTGCTINGTAGNITCTNDGTLGGDIAVNGGDLTTTNATATVFNTNATTVNFAGAANTINFGIPGAVGTLAIMGGSGSTGCTLDGTTGNLACSGTITSNGNAAFVQNGNSFGAAAVLGTNDGNTLSFETGGTTRATFDTTNGLSFTNGIAMTSGAATAISITTGTTGALTLDSGTTGAVNLGTNANAKTISIGNVTGATALNLSVGTGNFTLNGVAGTNYTVGAATVAGTITIGGTAQTGTMTLGSSSAANTINIGTGAGATAVVIGNNNSGTLSLGTSANAKTITIGNNTGASALSLITGTGNFSLDGVGATTYTIGAATVAGTITIGGTAATGTMTLGSSSAANTINIGTGAGATAVVIGNNNTGTLSLGTSANAKVITVGNATGATSVTLNTGTGGLTATTATTGNISLTTGTTGTVTIDSGTTGAINLGTNANAKAISIGNATGATSLNFDAGTGGVTLNTATTGTIVIQSGTTGAVTLDSGTTGTVNVGTNANAKTVNIGNVTGASVLNLNAGTGGMFIAVAAMPAAAGGNLPVCWNAATGLLRRGGSQTQCNPSSLRYKENVVDITESMGLDVINALRPVAYDYISDGSHALGFIAEEVADIDERMIVRDSEGLVDAIDSDRFFPAIVKAIQQIDDRVNLGFAQNGNSFGATGVLGTNDTNSLSFETNGVTRATFDTANGLSFGNGIAMTTGAATAFSVTTGTTGALNLDTGTTGTINLGVSASAKIINIGTGAGAATVNIGNNNTGAVNIASSANAQTVTIGNNTGTSALNLAVGTGNFVLNGAASSTYTIGASTTTGTITIGGTAQTGTMTLGSSSGTNTINIGTGAGATAVNIGSNNTGAVNIGTSANAKTITIGNTTGATALNLNTGTGGFTAVTGTTGNISITSGTTGTVTLDSGTTGAVNIGTNANSKAVTIGNVTGTSTLSLQAGSGGIIMPTASLGAVVTGNFTLCRNGTTGRLFIGASQTQCNPSSARYKHDIVDIALGLDTVRALRPVAYTYNENNELSLGFIAEELFLIDPRLVVLDDQGLPNAIDTDRILPILTKGIQEVDLTVTALQTTVASLQTTVTDNYNALTIQDANLLNLYNLLESRVAGLETRVNALESNGIDKTVVGEATVLTGATEVVVTFATPMTGVPVVQVTPSGENFLLSNLKYTVTDRTVNGFKIKIDFAQLEDFAFGWSAKAP